MIIWDFILYLLEIICAISFIGILAFISSENLLIEGLFMKIKVIFRVGLVSSPLKRLLIGVIIGNDNFFCLFQFVGFFFFVVGCGDVYLSIEDIPSSF